MDTKQRNVELTEGSKENPDLSKDDIMKNSVCRRCCSFGNSSPRWCYIPVRYIVTVLAGIGMMLVYAMRINLGVTVILILDYAPHTKVGTPEAKEAIWHVSITP